MKFLLPVGILSATVIGAGVFSLPFIFESAGFWLGTSYLVFFTLIFWLTHTMYADIILRTERLPGFVLYVRKYLGAWAQLPATLASTIGIILASAVYLVLAASFVRLLFNNIHEPLVVYMFWALGSLAIFLKVERLALFESIVLGAVLVLIGIIFILGISYGDYSARNFSILPASVSTFFLPFGPILFSLAGRSAIPSLLEDMASEHLAWRSISSIIFWGTAIPGVFYLAFVLGIWGLSDIVSYDSVSGISRGPAILLSALGVIGTLSLFTTYIPLSVSVKKILEADFNFSHLASGTVVIISPILVYLTGLGFVELIAITGGVFLAIESIFIALVWHRLNALGKPPFLLRNFGSKTAYIIVTVFLIGMVAEVVNNAIQAYS